MKNFIPKSVIAFTLASSMAGCAALPGYVPVPDGNIYGGPPGTTGVSAPPPVSVRPTYDLTGQQCMLSRSLRARHFDTAGNFLRDFEVGRDFVAGPCGSTPDAYGRCFVEVPVGVPSTSSGGYAGQVAVGIRAQGMPCPANSPRGYVLRR